jgi:hypothetical protein
MVINLIVQRIVTFLMVLFMKFYPSCQSTDEKYNFNNSNTKAVIFTVTFSDVLENISIFGTSFLKIEVLLTTCCIEYG